MLIQTLTHAVATALGFCIAYQVLAPDPVPDPPPGSTVTLVAVLPDHHRLYKITSTSLIVPAYVVVSPAGHVAIR